MSEYAIKKLEHTQFELLIPLMKNCFGKDVSIDYFKWKFLDNPAGNFVGFIAVKEDTQEVGAYYGVIPEKYLIEGKETTIFQSCDTMTHTNHRRKGLFQKLAIHCYEHLRENDNLFVIGFGGGQSTPGFIKFGWRRVFDFRSYFVPQVLCYTSFLSKAQSANCQTITDLTELNELIKPQGTAKIHSSRNLEHLIWRYGNPLNNYKILGFRRDSKLEGFVCYYLQDDKLFLFDFVFKTDHSRKALLNQLKREVLRENLKGIVAFCQENGKPAASLKKGGFMANPFKKGPLSEKTPFIFYSDEPTMNRFSDESAWSIGSYDHDAL